MYRFICAKHWGLWFTRHWKTIRRKSWFGKIFKKTNYLFFFAHLKCVIFHVKCKLQWWRWWINHKWIWLVMSKSTFGWKRINVFRVNTFSFFLMPNIAFYRINSVNEQWTWRRSTFKMYSEFPFVHFVYFGGTLLTTTMEKDDEFRISHSGKNENFANKSRTTKSYSKFVESVPSRI